MGGEFLEAQRLVAVLVLLAEHFLGLGGVFLAGRAGLELVGAEFAVSVGVELLEDFTGILLRLAGFAGCGCCWGLAPAAGFSSAAVANMVPIARTVRMLVIVFHEVTVLFWV